MADFFNESVSRTYDERNRALLPIAENMHFLIRLLLKDVPQNARILCVGVGTGAEIFSLAREYPGFTFVGVDPSSPMLEVCKERLQEAGLLSRCELIHGYVEDVPTDNPFDAALSILVGHFVKREERVSFYKNMHDRLKHGGYFINTELSFDVESEEFSSMVHEWGKVQTGRWTTPESLAALPRTLREVLTVLSPEEVAEIMRESSFTLPVEFFRSFMIAGWFAVKR